MKSIERFNKEYTLNTIRHMFFFIVTLEGAITAMVFIFNQTQRRGAVNA